MKQDFNTLRWSAVLGLTVVATSGLLGACNSHPVEFAQATGAISVHEERSPDSAAAVDILWVIDNSGSMCEEQGALRDNFQQFITQISDQNIDFHIGVTTTHMKDIYPLETVARPGHLQSMPQPVPTYIPTCHGSDDDPEDPNDAMDGYKPIREALAVAVDDCTKDPSQWQGLKSISDDDIACHLDRSCGEPHEMFPTAPDGTQPYAGMPATESPYRDIPKVLRFGDYRDDAGNLDVEGLRKDFACMSLVGTRGYSIEKGLAAAVKAVSPEMTGGTLDEPTDKDAPNHGFLRDAAKFAVIFVTDETDCSQSGQYEHFADEEEFEGTTCSGQICAFANAPGLENSPLIPAADLADSLKQNLTASKGYDVENDSVIAASIHGRWKRYGVNYPDGQPLTPQECKGMQERPDPEGRGEQTSCNTTFGTAYSGDRYERFLRQFDPEQVFPKIPDNPNTYMDGLICRPGEIANTLESLGRTIAGSVSQCIYQVPYACDSSDQCPAFAFGGGTPECLPFGQKPNTSYCNSGLQLRLYPGKDDGDKTFADLQNHEYCIPESIDSSMTPGGCVIKRDKYAISACPGAPELAINLTWTDDRYFNTLSGYEVELVYTLLPETDDSASNNGSETTN
ncbi:hypothetical protein FIV42_12375 [Persicimonas caeni]|uniref:VWA domain-containing protein n=1 Tax=Persicimonas caeni TaxID=2292766 RepID=A0A4Y6PT77_PERCE|nr:hypothetical protein [Persicimonas caeni]QDG51511.1 hypothetical protein FIV42_12375 [Persicimonas caeni]QED32732.1 hypothetical protein FRD00_12370 [Persicimonas caeni]